MIVGPTDRTASVKLVYERVFACILGDGLCGHGEQFCNVLPIVRLVDDGQLGAEDRVDAYVALRDGPFVVLVGEDGALHAHPAVFGRRGTAARDLEAG